MCQLIVNDIDINIKKLETDEFEFNLIINDNDYYSKSFLKDLQFITNFKKYIDFCKDNIKCQKINGSYILELPIPFSDKYQLINLIKIDYKQQIKELQNEVDNLDELNKEYNYMYSLFKSGSGDFLPHYDGDVINILMVRNDTAMIADYKPYISKSNLFSPKVAYNYKLTRYEITYGRDRQSIIDPYVELSRFGYKESGLSYIEILNTVLLIIDYKKIENIKIDNAGSNGKYLFMKIHIDNSKKNKINFVPDKSDKYIKVDKIYYDHNASTVNSKHEIILYYE